MSSYENHVYSDSEFPIIYHLDQLEDSGSTFLHWHENIELLYFIEGKATLKLNHYEVTAKKGDLVIVNPETLHRVNTEEEKQCQYYCLIVDKSLYDSLGLILHHELFEPLVQDSHIKAYFELLVKEMNDKKEDYQLAVKQLITLIFIELQRKYRVENGEQRLADTGNKKIEIVKSALAFIRKNYRSRIKTEDICTHIGFSPYYFCHVFKEVTGKNVVDYINFLRCTYAQKLLQSGSHNVCESAELSGFNTLSYFSKTYKKVFGKLPSEEWGKS